MKIDSISIRNYKSLVDIKIDKPNPFTVFVGPNASGKSNILEAIEFFHTSLLTIYDEKIKEIFGGGKDILCRINNEKYVFFKYVPEKGKKVEIKYFFNKELQSPPSKWNREFQSATLIKNLSRLFINNYNINRQKSIDNQKLDFYASNLEKVLKRLLKEEIIREEIIEWLQLFIPEFENIDVSTNELSGDDSLLIYEKFTKKPFPKNLISDGAFNILALLTAVYQSDEPQFLCIEEPENGLNPQVIKELVGFFREVCEEKGHYIWLTTHSQTLVSELQPKEIIIVDKKNGETKIKQFKNLNLHGLKMDEAWLSNVLGGGLPW